MLIVVLLLLLLWIVLMVLMSAWALLVQGYLYTEVTPGILWRGPTAGTVVMASLVVWFVMAAGAPGRYRALWEFSAGEDRVFPEIEVGKDVYKLRPGTRGDYRLNGLKQGRRLPERPMEFTVTEGEAKSTFKAELDANGKFLRRKVTRFGRDIEEPLRYLDDQGRIMYEGELGQINQSRIGWFLGNIFLNVLFFLALFLSMWLILSFHWPHALGQAVVLWLLILLFVLPPLLNRLEGPARPASRAMLPPAFPIALVVPTWHCVRG